MIKISPYGGLKEFSSRQIMNAERDLTDEVLRECIKRLPELATEKTEAENFAMIRAGSREERDRPRRTLDPLGGMDIDIDVTLK